MMTFSVNVKPFMHNVPNGQIHFENIAAFAVRFLKYV